MSQPGVAERVIVFKGITDSPGSDEAAKQRAEAEYRRFFHVADEVSLEGEWWGVVDSVERTVHRCETEEAAIELGRALADRHGVSLWYQPPSHRHQDARRVSSLA